VPSVVTEVVAIEFVLSRSIITINFVGRSSKQVYDMTRG